MRLLLAFDYEFIDRNNAIFFFFYGLTLVIGLDENGVVATQVLAWV